MGGFTARARPRGEPTHRTTAEALDDLRTMQLNVTCSPKERGRWNASAGRSGSTLAKHARRIFDLEAALSSTQRLTDEERAALEALAALVAARLR